MKEQKIQWITLEEKIKKILKENEVADNEKLTKQLKTLFLQSLHPEQFCPKCNDQLFIQNGKYVCMNCGYQLVAEKEEKKNIPPQVEKLLSQTEKKAPGAVGEKIKKLVQQIDSGSATPTQNDINRLKQDPNVRDINFV